MRRREHLDERDVGISAAASAAIGHLLEEPAETYTVHFVLRQSAETPYAPRRTACGLDGVEPNTNTGTESHGLATCPSCRAEIARWHAKEDLRSLRSLAKAAKHRSKLAGPRRWRLVDAGLAEVRGDYIAITPAGLAHLQGGAA